MLSSLQGKHILLQATKKWRIEKRKMNNPFSWEMIHDLNNIRQKLMFYPVNKLFMATGKIASRPVATACVGTGTLLGPKSSSKLDNFRRKKYKNFQIAATTRKDKTLSEKLRMRMKFG